MKLAEAPKAMSTAEKPAMNKQAFTTIAVLNRDRHLGICQLFNPQPRDVRDVRGDAHGDTNESRLLPKTPRSTKFG